MPPQKFKMRNNQSSIGTRPPHGSQAMKSIAPNASKMSSLPAELQIKIFEPLIDEIKQEISTWDIEEPYPCDITVARRQPPRWYGGSLNLPRVFEHSKGLLLAFAGTACEMTIATILNESFSFESFLCESIRRLPNILDKQYIRYIRRLHLDMDEGMEKGHEKVCPEFIEVMSNGFPNLTSLTITNSYEWTGLSAKKLYPILMRLMAFMIERLHHEFRLILPAKRELESTAKSYMAVSLILERVELLHKDEQWLSFHPDSDNTLEAPREWDKFAQVDADDQRDLGTTEDEVLNATAIRRMTMSELETHHPSNFIIKPDEGMSKDNIISSKVPEQHCLYDIVDKRGYQTWETHRANNWKRRTTDEMILFCRKRELKIEAQRARRARASDMRNNIHVPEFVPVAHTAQYQPSNRMSTTSFFPQEHYYFMDPAYFQHSFGIDPTNVEACYGSHVVPTLANESGMGQENLDRGVNLE